ncbi:MAG: S9 family peptidase [Candidatus Eremiobacterota bacterium]
MNSSSPFHLELIPRRILFGSSGKMRVKISPDGKKLSYLAPVNNVLNIWVKTIGSDDDRVVTDDKERSIRFYFWAQNNEDILYLQDEKGKENWNIYKVSLKTGEIANLTPYEHIQASIINTDKRFPDEILIQMNRENPVATDVYRLNLKSGQLQMAAKNPGHIKWWVKDGNMNVSAGVGPASDGKDELIIRKGENEWERIDEWGYEDSFSNSAICITRDGKYICLIDSRNSNTGRLLKINIQTGEKEVLFHDPRYDFDGWIDFSRNPDSILLHPDTYEIEAITCNREKKEWVILDKNLEDDFKAIKKFSEGEFHVVSRDSLNEKWIICFDCDNESHKYYLFDRPARKGEFLFYSRPEMNEYTFSKMETISFTARDGLEINGYISYPPGENRKNLPLVLYVHGGPWSRDVWGFNPVTQWITNRGYVCLQVNFRGSKGFGKDFLNAGDREWGGKMQDDLADGVRWAIEQGISDPKRIAIYGGSYGGYAALAGAAFTPDLFCCAVAYFAISNLLTYIKSIPPQWEVFRNELVKRIGDPDKEEDFLKSRSPLFSVDKIKIPVMILHGANDPRIKKLEAEQIEEAMKQKGLPCECVIFSDEGHGLAGAENKNMFFGKIEKFFAKYLGGRYEEFI